MKDLNDAIAKECDRLNRESQETLEKFISTAKAKGLPFAARLSFEMSDTLKGHAV